MSMELSDLNKQIEELRPQIAAELDPVLRGEMRKTFKHYQRQLRKHTTYRKPWYGLGRLVIFLAVVFLGMVYACTEFVHAFGLKSTLPAVGMAVVGTVLVTAIAFVVLKIISPDTYSQLVQACLATVSKWMPGKSENDAKSLPPAQTNKTPPQLPPASAPPAAPEVNFDVPSVSAINADEDQASPGDE
jgi:hypothetical protein